MVVALRAAVLLLLLFVLTPVDADSGVPNAGLEVGVVAETLLESRNAAGEIERRMVPVQVLHEGEEIFYTLRIRNVTGAPITDAVVVWPVPPDTRYIPNSAAGPGAEIAFSVDGGQTYAAPNALSVTRNGSARDATAADYTDIRWHLRYPLASGAVALARFRAIFR
jgi:uncharacterized repeat protein (TIGR01451 family)